MPKKIESVLFKQFDMVTENIFNLVMKPLLQDLLDYFKNPQVYESSSEDEGSEDEYEESESEEDEEAEKSNVEASSSDESDDEPEPEPVPDYNEPEPDYNFIISQLEACLEKPNQWWKIFTQLYNYNNNDNDFHMSLWEHRDFFNELCTQLASLDSLYDLISIKNDYDPVELQKLNDSLQEINLFSVVIPLRIECEIYLDKLNQDYSNNLKKKNADEKIRINEKKKKLMELQECFSSEKTYHQQLDDFKTLFNTPETKKIFKQYDKRGESFFAVVKIALAAVTFGIALIPLIAYSRRRTNSAKFWQSEKKRLMKNALRPIKNLEKQYEKTIPTQKELEQKLNVCIQLLMDRIIKSRLIQLQHTNPNLAVQINYGLKNNNLYTCINLFKNNNQSDGVNDITNQLTIAFEIQNLLATDNLNDESLKSMNHDLNELHQFSILLPLRDNCKQYLAYLQNLNTNKNSTLTAEKITAMENLISSISSADQSNSSQLADFKIVLSDRRYKYEELLEKSADARTKAFLKSMHQSLETDVRIPSEKKKGVFSKFWRSMERKDNIHESVISMSKKGKFNQ